MAVSLALIPSAECRAVIMDAGGSKLLLSHVDACRLLARKFRREKQTRCAKQMRKAAVAALSNISMTQKQVEMFYATAQPLILARQREMTCYPGAETLCVDLAMAIVDFVNVESPHGQHPLVPPHALPTAMATLATTNCVCPDCCPPPTSPSSSPTQASEDAGEESEPDGEPDLPVLSDDVKTTASSSVRINCCGGGGARDGERLV